MAAVKQNDQKSKATSPTSVLPDANGHSTWNDPDLQQQLPNHLRPDPDKPVAIYVPGLDGYGISACTHQFNDLATTFQLWRLLVATADRSSFGQVVQAIVDGVHDITASANNKNDTLIGESCGGVLAAGAALRLQERLTGLVLVLVNPATCFHRTPWADGTVDHDSSFDAVRGPGADQIARAIQEDLRPGTKDHWTQQLDLLRTSLQSMQLTEERPLRHRAMEWLDLGAIMVNGRLPLHHTAPTLIVAGAEDRLLPSQEELCNAETLIVKRRGHFVLDDSVNLTDAIVFSNINPSQRPKKQVQYDPIMDWRVPSDVDKYIQEAVEPLRDAFGPVFFSTDAKGKRWKGLGKVSSDRGGP